MFDNCSCTVSGCVWIFTVHQHCASQAALTDLPTTSVQQLPGRTCGSRCLQRKHSGDRPMLRSAPKRAPRVGRVDGNACMTSSTDRDGAATQAWYPALPSGDVRCRRRAASDASPAKAASASSVSRCAGARTSACSARARRRDIGPAGVEEMS